jgi:hypothetical protein
MTEKPQDKRTNLTAFESLAAAITYAAGLGYQVVMTYDVNQAALVVVLIHNLRAKAARHFVSQLEMHRLKDYPQQQDALIQKVLEAMLRKFDENDSSLAEVKRGASPT